ncbi:unnamed protein product [Candidula unifasciata]|uniref:LFRFamide-1 n=1 Tax=Candidula unifasciata TaxID=100452 RepID=A0A8S3ZGN4_9EUPU|nr:unnamed protein product [Candidula unifasciata]
MEHTLLTLTLGLLLTVSSCLNSEDVFPAISQHSVDKRSPVIPSLDEENAVEVSDDQLDSPYDPEDTDKRGGLFRFGKRQGSLFRFGKRQGSLFRFGKRGSLFRFGKRQGSLFRFGKRGGSLFRFGRSGTAQDLEDDAQLDKRTLFRFGKRSDVLPHVLAQADLLNNSPYLDNIDN